VEILFPFLPSIKQNAKVSGSTTWTTRSLYRSAGFRLLEIRARSRLILPFAGKFGEFSLEKMRMIR